MGRTNAAVHPIAISWRDPDTTFSLKLEGSSAGEDCYFDLPRGGFKVAVPDICFSNFKVSAPRHQIVLPPEFQGPQTLRLWSQKLGGGESVHEADRSELRGRKHAVVYGYDKAAQLLPRDAAACYALKVRIISVGMVGNVIYEADFVSSQGWQFCHRPDLVPFVPVSDKAFSIAPSAVVTVQLPRNARLLIECGSLYRFFDGNVEGVVRVVCDMPRGIALFASVMESSSAIFYLPARVVNVEEQSMYALSGLSLPRRDFFMPRSCDCC